MKKTLKQLIQDEVRPTLGRWDRSQHILLAEIVHRDLERRHPSKHFAWLYVLRIVKETLNQRLELA